MMDVVDNILVLLCKISIFAKPKLLSGKSLAAPLFPSTGHQTWFSATISGRLSMVDQVLLGLRSTRAPEISRVPAPGPSQNQQPYFTDSKENCRALITSPVFGLGWIAEERSFPLALSRVW